MPRSTDPPLFESFPVLERRLPRRSLSRLPTPLVESEVAVGGRHRTLLIKADDCTGTVYGGNKLRKLDYLFGRVLQKGRCVVATFGTVASNHALATAACAREVGIRPVCFLSHQSRTPHAAAALRYHAHIGSELVPWIGSAGERRALLRRHLWGRDAAVVPMGGSSWAGTVGFVNAGLEVASQVAAAAPPRIYLATGTMGSAAGLALGLALADCAAEVHAVRVSPDWLCNEQALNALMKKTALMLYRLDASIDPALHRRARIVLRHEFFGPGYARSTPETDAAMEVASLEAGLELEPTYTGKAFAALLADLKAGTCGAAPPLFWNSYHPIPAAPNDLDAELLPAAFARYLD